MKNVKIIINATVAENTNEARLRHRVMELIRRLSNPVREDEGILTINGARIEE